MFYTFGDNKKYYKRGHKSRKNLFFYLPFSQSVGFMLECWMFEQMCKVTESQQTTKTKILRLGENPLEKNYFL